jgi:hypothetical protein
MPHPTKKQRIECHERNEEVAVADDDFLASFDDLSIDVLANALGFLQLKDIMSKRRINKKTREAVKKTTVPLTDFGVFSVENYNTMAVMTEALPNLQRITLGSLRTSGHKYVDGEDPEEGWAAQTADRTTHDIGIISNFSKLRILAIKQAPLNGRYPFLFNSFPLLQKLSIHSCKYLKWDLEMLAGLPLLKELDCDGNSRLTGNIGSLRVLKDILEKVTIECCENVEGNFMDLADLPNLIELYLFDTAVTGDIRDIGENDFLSLKKLALPKGVYGGSGYEFQSISDGPDVVRTLYLLNKQRPALLDIKYWFATLSEASPDWYGSVGEDDDGPPFCISFFEAGSRIGYQWETGDGSPCEVNWLDPEPERESSEYGKYTEELQRIERQGFFYKGFHQPPTEEEYNQLWVRLEEEGEWW